MFPILNFLLFYMVYEEYANYKVLIKTLHSLINVGQTDYHMLPIDSKLNDVFTKICCVWDFMSLCQAIEVSLKL